MVAPYSFSPGLTQTLTISASSQSLALNPDAPLLRLIMVGGSVGGVTFVRVGTGAQVAVTTDYPIPASTDCFVTKGVGANTIAAIGNAAAAGALLYVTTGG